METYCRTSHIPVLKHTAQTCESMDVRLVELEIAERRVRLRSMEHDLTERQHNLTERRFKMSRFLKEDAKNQENEAVRMAMLDAADTLVFRECQGFKDPSAVLSIANNDDGSQISISSVAMSMGLRLDNHDLSKVGREVAVLYRKKYGQDPGKSLSLTNGKVIPINCYFKKDVDLIKTALNTFKHGGWVLRKRSRRR